MKYRRSRFTKLVLIASFFLSIACADYFSYELYSVFYPETSPRPRDSDKYFFTFYYPYGEDSYTYGPTSNDTILNTDAWYQYFGKKLPQHTIKIELHKKEILSDDFIKKVKSVGKNDALNYLVSLKELDALIADKRESYWDERSPVDTLKIKGLVSKWETDFVKEKDDFIKERYLYLLIKSSAAIKDHKNVIRIYEKYQSTIRNKSFVSEWSQSYYAGAFYHTNNTARSFYEFSKVFAHCPSRREVANLSVKAFSIPFSDEVIKLCASNEEKANVYVLYGLQNFSDIVSAAEKIWELQPNHEMLPLIVGRAINQQEQYFFKAKNEHLYWEDEEKLKQQLEERTIIAPSQLQRIEGLISQIINGQKLENVDFYHLADAYLQLLDQNNEEAQQSLDKVKNIENDAFITKQQKTLSILQKLQSGVVYDEESFGPVLDDLSFLAKSLNTARDASVMKYLSQKLINYFYRKEIPYVVPKKSFWNGCSKQKEIKPSELLLARDFFARCLSVLSPDWNAYHRKPKLGGYEMQTFLDTMQLDLLESAIHLIESKNISSVDNHFYKICNLSHNQLYLEYGRKLMLHHNFEKAFFAFKGVEKKYLDSIMSLTEVLSKPKLQLKSEDPTLMTDPLDYVKSLSKLKEKVIKNPNDAFANYQYAEALINISYHGNAWLLSNSYKSGSEPFVYDWNSDRKRYSMDTKLMKDYYGLETAFIHIEKALKYSRDSELSAKVLYLAALFDGNLEWIHEEISETNEEDTSISFFDQVRKEQELEKLSYFNKLKTQYTQTKYAKMLIQECDDFAKYVPK